jgi:hypothetical protein
MKSTLKAALAGAIVSLAMAAGSAQAAPVSSDAVRGVAAQSSSQATPVGHRHWHRNHAGRHCGYVRRCNHRGCRILRRCHRHW